MEGKRPIIVSGFEPFGGRAVNASYEFARAIQEQFPEVTLLQVPVLWGAAAEVVESALAASPALWFACGESPTTFRIETCARNFRSPRRDNLGNLPPASPIAEKGAVEFSNRFDGHRVAQELIGRGYPCLLSEDAGAYLCEELFYTLLLKQTEQPETEILFLHVPHFGSELTINGELRTFRGDCLRQAARDFYEAVERQARMRA